MCFLTSFFNKYDLRGTYPDEIGPEEAEKVGKAYGTFTDAEEVLVGRDGRKHGDEITESFIQGITSTGTDVIFIGLVTTPMVYFGVYSRKIESGAMVTASHNPPEYTGFKFCKKEALSMSREGGMKQIEQIYHEESFKTGEGEMKEIDLEEEYIEFVSDKIDLERELDVAVNFGNGSASEIGKKLLEAIGCNVESVNGEVDGEFPNHLPAPGEEEAQRQLEEKMDGKDLGILFDGDGDRTGFIVPGYGYLEPDTVMAVFSEKVLNHKKGKVIHDLRASKLVPETVENNGGTAEEMRVGHTFFSEAIHEDPEIVFGAEISGHYSFPGLGVPWDDGIFTAALMCEIASETDLKEKPEQYPDYPVSPELRIDCPEEAKQKIIERIKEEYSDHDLETVDGVKIKFQKGWALVRPSSTEEKMSIRCEADTEEKLKEIREEVEESVRELINRRISKT